MMPIIRVISKIAQEVNDRVGRGTQVVPATNAGEIYSKLPERIKAEIAHWGCEDAAVKRMIFNHLLHNI